MNVLHTRAGIHIIDDTYNANPGSMAGALDSLRTLREGHRSFVVMGDMKELGHHAAGLHHEVGSRAARSGITGLFTTGEFAGETAAGAAQAGLEKDSIVIGSKVQIVSALIERLQPEDWVLVKGSRAMAMEEIVQQLVAWAETKTGEQ